jgi:glycosyltransferase involved in cell wall biosynthesis
MIYLDVTSACLSPLNTGVKRMQRFLHSRLCGRADYQPVVWQSFLKSYRTPTLRDLHLLESPFKGAPVGIALYDSFLPGFWRDAKESLSDRRLLMRWPATMSKDDLLLVPDLLWDNRGGFFAKPFPYGVKKIAIFHDAISITVPGQSRLDAVGCARGIRALSRFDRVVCLSRTAEKDLHDCWKEQGCDPVPTEVLPWPVPFELPRPETTLPTKSEEILYVARLEKRKNHLVLLDACERLWNEGMRFRLRLIGCKSYPIWTWRVLNRIHSLKERGRDLVWMPHVSDAVLHEAYKACSFTVFPSVAEGFGLPVLESLWHGRPVLCNSEGAVGELAEGGGCHMVDANNPVKLAGGIQSLFEDGVTYNRLRQECIQRKMLSWSDYWNSLRGFIQP